MKVAIFTDTYVPDVNGVALTLEGWVKYLTKNGHQVKVFAPKAAQAEELTNEEMIQRYRAFPFFLYPELQAALPAPHLVDQELLNFGPDIVHLATPFNLGFAGRYFSLKYDFPLVASYHTNFDQYLKSYQLEWAGPILEKYSLWFHEVCQRIYVPSTATKDLLEGKGYKNISFWKRGIRTDLFKPVGDHSLSQADLKEKYGMNPDRFTILYVGRIATEKNLDVFLNVAHSLTRNYPGQLEFAMAGDGPYMEEFMKKMAEKNLNFNMLGFRPQEELAEIYAASDLFFFPSATETFGNVVLEAMASGLAVVGADAGGVKDLVTTGRTGFLCHPENEREFYHSIELLYQSQLMRQVFSKEARAFAMKQSWELIFAGLLESYQSVIKEKEKIDLANHY